jgi:heterodisulfide reductase subunit A-like polyferredoxin
VTLKKKPRFVDLAKCTGCGDCAKICPVSLPDTFNLGLADRKAIYRLYPQAIPSGFSIDKLDRAPCTLTCPAGINVQGYVQLIKMGKYAEAVQLIMERLPLPGVLGRVCPHPCEDKCRRRDLDEPIAICNLKRFAADQVDLEKLPMPLREARPEKIAIIGSGPAGLACAYSLARQGYRPTIFEAMSQTGGMLRVGIPDYRLPKDVLDREIDNILRLGVELKTNTALGRDFTLDDLTNQGFQAIFIGVGCHVGAALGIPGEDVKGVMQGVDFLRDLNTGKNPPVGKKMAVIGGGNVAFDVARSARRLGAEVIIVYRRSREEMPANPEEIEEAGCEGIPIQYLAAPQQIIVKDNKVAGLECLRMELGEADSSGRRRPVPIPGSEYVLEVDMVVPAIGQKANLNGIEGAEIKTTRWGTIEVNPVTYETSRPGVFAAGDVHTGPWIAISAVAGGMEAAESIERYLQGADLTQGRDLGEEAKAMQQWTDIPLDEEKKSREAMPQLGHEVCCTCFDEVMQGYTEAQAQGEAERCLNCGVCSECMQCVEVCQAKAVDHEQQPETVTLQVGSVILAPGYRTFNPAGIDTYLYGKHPNVVTTMEFERMLSPGGPFQGHITRRSDGREPKKIAWVLCVGSRSEKPGEHPYCSNVCCMTGLKQAIVAQEHIGADLDMAVFYMDMRTTRKDFEKYMVGIESRGARLVRSRVHSILPEGREGDLRVQYITEEGEAREEVFDMVVLAVGMEIAPDARLLAEKLGVELSPNDFVETSCFAPVSTTRPGLFACGAFTSPKDIPQSVMEGSSAAAAATRDLAAARGTLLKKKIYPIEKGSLGDEARVGVFICNCGINIGGVADVPGLVDYAQTIPNVAYVQDNLFSCSEDAQKQMVEKIHEYDLNRVVVAACSPSTHQPIFQDMLRNAGLNKYLFEMANIRNQCTWVHQGAPVQATEKCRDLINMAVAKSRLMEPLEYLKVGINRRALVVGGGTAGMTSALALADQGYYVHLLERTDRLGGNALKLHTSWRRERIRPFVYELIAKIENHDHIQVHFEAIVTGVAGSTGNFTTKLSNGVEIEHGIVVIAIGAEPFRPEGMYLYKQHPNVLLSLDLDRELARNSARVREAEAAAFIQCVGSRIPERPYCSRVCCSHSVENALRLKELNPDMDVYILYRDMRTYGERELLYEEARRKGVIFIRYRLNDPPVADFDGDKIRLTVVDHVLQRPITFNVDLLTLATAIIPHRNAPLAELYKIPLNAEGFFTEAHAKIKPVDASAEGIYLAGLCHYPKPIQESIAEGLATASRANTILSREYLELESTISNPIDENCDGCAFCVDSCPFQAITLLEYMKDGSQKKTIEVNEILCKGCGSCMATCPKKGVTIAGFSLDQLDAQIDAALGLL